jgi:hypothetical protein
MIFNVGPKKLTLLEVDHITCMHMFPVKQLSALHFYARSLNTVTTLGNIFIHSVTDQNFILSGAVALPYLMVTLPVTYACHPFHSKTFK